MADSKDSSSRSISETVNGSHKFTIQGYSLLKGKGMGKCISSCTFPVGGYEWAVYFYPDGKNPEDNAVYVSVFIALASEGTDVRALFELTLMDQSDKGKHKVHSHFDRALESGPYTLKYKGSMWGYKRFFRRTTLEASDYLKDDCLVMKCTVGVIRTRLEGPKNYSISVSPSEMGLCFKDMLESEVGCDIVFQVGDDTFKAHKLVLAARSPVFQAQFYGLVGDSNMDKVVVKDVDPLVFKAMLFFIYTDSLPDLHEITDTDSLPDLHEITSTDSLPDLHEITGSVSICMSNIVQHLLAVADLYSLDRLKLLCESKLCEELNPDTVATTLVLAEQHGCKQLKSNCLKFATCPSNLGVVMQSDGYKHLECFPPLLSELLWTVASVDENSSQQSSKKRCSSSVIGLDLTPEDATPEAAAAAGAAAEPANPIGRRLRRRV